MKTKILLILLTLVYFSGCGIYKQEHDIIIIMSNKILTSIQYQNYTGISKYFSDELRHEVTEANFQNYIAKSISDDGEILTWKLAHRELVYSDSTYYVYSFKVKHKKSTTIHILTFIKISKKDFKLLKYSIESTP